MSQLISATLVTKLTQVRDRIKRASEELDGAVAAVENYLKQIELKYPASTWVEGPDGAYRVSYGLFSKTGEWRLILEKVRVEHDGKRAKATDVEMSCLLAEAPKHLMILGAGALPNVVDGVAVAAEAEAERLEAAVTAIKGPSDEVTIVDTRTRDKLDREFLELYAKRMSEDTAVRV